MRLIHLHGLDLSNHVKYLSCTSQNGEWLHSHLTFLRHRRRYSTKGLARHETISQSTTSSWVFEWLLSYGHPYRAITRCSHHVTYQHHSGVPPKENLISCSPEKRSSNHIHDRTMTAKESLSCADDPHVKGSIHQGKLIF